MAKPLRLSWFSPFPPVKTGIAGRSAELVDTLRGRGHTIDEYPEARAHDFPWRRRLEPYDLAIYQFGNSSHHDYEWPYALRYPGLVVLHDTHLHHARAALLLREKRAGDYRAEFRWSEADASPDAAELAIAGFDSALYYDWPFVRSLVDASRLVAVHGWGARQQLVDTLARSEYAEKIVAIRLGEGVPVSPGRETRARHEVRAKYTIPGDAVLFGCFGGLTPEKRITQIIGAFRAIQPYAPAARLLLAGTPAAHLDVAAEISRAMRAMPGSDAAAITLAGYLETDDELTDHIAACDVTLNLRWPTARETSGPWLRALAAGKPTVITDLTHLIDVPSLDPRTWHIQEGGGWRMEDGKSHPPSSTLHPPICVAIDILDEDHSLRLAMRRLATDADLRARLSSAAREYWMREHTVDAMANDYERVMHAALAANPPAPPPRAPAGAPAPAHLAPSGDETLRAILARFGLPSPL